MKQTVFQLPQVRILGRHVPTDGALTLFYTASGIECLCTGSELWLELNADYAQYEPWLSIELNGAWLSRFPVAPGRSRVCVFRGMTPGTPKRVRVLKDVQAMHDDPRHLVQITALCWEEGDFLPLPAPRYRLEFVGDSITSGEGAIGARGEEDWVPAFFSAMNHYGRMTADRLQAEYRLVSQSGWGILSSWDNRPECRVLAYYDKVCGVAAGARNAALGAGQPNDFAAWPADAVIVNLGTNDVSALHNPAWTDPVTGRTFQQTDTPENRAALVRAVGDGLAMLRRCNPGALLVWAYGMLGAELRPTLEEAVARYCRESGDARARFLPLPPTEAADFGARHHPGVTAHRRAADTLAAFLERALAGQSPQGKPAEKDNR